MRVRRSGLSRSSARRVTLLPEPEFADQRHHFAAPKLEIDAVNGLHRTEGDAQAADRDEGGGHARSPLSRKERGVRPRPHAATSIAGAREWPEFGGTIRQAARWSPPVS